MTKRYHAHGMLVDSDVELSLPTAYGRTDAVADVVLRCNPDAVVPAAEPEGDVIARLAAHDGGVFYSIVRNGDRTHVRYPGLCDFVGDSTLQQVRVTLSPGRDRGVVPVLAGGLLLALCLRLRGHLVLHASAVQVHDGAVAFVGSSGMGKSTMATVLCRAGHLLLTDDVLRVDLQEQVLVHAGATEARLRPAAHSLAVGVRGGGRSTADGRLAVAPVGYTGSALPLHACVVPQPDREIDRVEVRRVTGTDALVLLSRFPRILGWSEPTTLAREFGQLAELVGRVPVFEARIPWGPPFAPGIACDLVTGIGLIAQR